jgi:hypothetical protein
MVLPREAATARSGMALYGIEGLTPSRTMINADASRVRTVYTVNAAEVVLLQEKQPPPEATANQGRVTFNGAPAVSTEKPADLALRRAQSPTVWSSVRGEVIITVRGADAAALGARVRLD